MCLPQYKNKLKDDAIPCFGSLNIKQLTNKKLQEKVKGSFKGKSVPYINHHLTLKPMPQKRRQKIFSPYMFCHYTNDLHLVLNLY